MIDWEMKDWEMIDWERDELVGTIRSPASFNFSTRTVPALTRNNRKLSLPCSKIYTNSKKKV